MGTFISIVSQLKNDPKKTEFFGKIDFAIGVYDELTNMMHQGSQFYTRLGDILNKLYQNIMDFKMSRDMEKNDILTKIVGSPQNVNLPHKSNVPVAGQFPNYQQPQVFQNYQMP